VFRNFSARLADPLRSLSRKRGTTLFMTLLAGFQAMLSKYSGQEDIAVGSPIAGRSREELEGGIGGFVNKRVMRTALAGYPTATELLGRVRKVCLEAYSHQDIPYERVVEELQPERDPSRNPIFQIMLSLQNAGLENFFAGHLKVEPATIVKP